MTARARIIRAASAVLASALIAGSALMTNTGAMAVELNYAPVAQEVEVVAPTAEDIAVPDQVETVAPETSTSPEAATEGQEEQLPAGEAEAPEGAPADTSVEPKANDAPAPDAEDMNEASVQAVDDTEASSDAVPAAAQVEAVMPVNSADKGATLTWGVKTSFRNYIKGPIAGGDVTAIGVGENDNGATFTWFGGATTDSSSEAPAAVTFSGGRGVYFEGHHGILDFTLTNPRIVITSTRTAELYMDAVGKEFVDTTTMGPAYEKLGAKIADVILPVPSVAAGVYTWTDAEATLTADAEPIFAGFYTAGQSNNDLDRLTFSGSFGQWEPADPIIEPVVTKTSLATSQKSISSGDSVQFTATVTPKDAAGSVQFFNGKNELGKAVKVSAGTATVTTKALVVGKHSITAKFTPADNTQFAASTAAAVSVTVAKKLQAKPVEADVSGATLSWGVKESFRKYIVGGIAKGSVTTLGSTKTMNNATQFTWSGGTGTVMTSGDKADVKFGGKNGVHFEGHHGILDFTISNPRVVITSAVSGELRMDARGLEFVSTTEQGGAYEMEDVKIADLFLSAPTLSGKTLKWTDAEAVLTDAGSEVFGNGNFYSKGDVLDPVSFSLPLDYDGEIILDDKIATATKLAASPAEINLDQSVTLTSTTIPAVDGKVTFRVPGAGIEKTVTAKKGKATLKLSKLEAINYTARATFTPENEAEYSASNSNSVQIKVTDPTKKNDSTASRGPISGQTAGSLSWGISSFFSTYTTEKSGSSACPTAGGHCANGEIVTSGVGAGWLFPQAASSNWNKETQTGTVQYSGVVSFNGYGQTMFQVSNPSITVNSATSATLNTGYSGSYGPSSVGLDLGSASKSVGANGEVTWSGVSVQGGLSGIRAGQDSGFDSLSFTVGAESAVSYGSTSAGDDKKLYEAAATAPTTTGITILTDEKKITAGSRLELEAPGFEVDDEGVLVVLYDGYGKNPVVLDDEASANSAGVVSWAGTLPKDASDKQIITVQGSIDAGAPLSVLKKQSDAKKKAAAENAVAPSEQQAKAAGIFGIDAGTSSGMATWEWWASAGGLVVIAGCMTLLAVRQRKITA